MVLLLVGCKLKEDQLQNKFLEYAEDYYKNYSVKGFNEVDISLNNLKQANEKTSSNYDLSFFNDCKDSSLIRLIINKNGEIDSVEYYLNCK